MDSKSDEQLQLCSIYFDRLIEAQEGKDVPDQTAKSGKDDTAIESGETANTIPQHERFSAGVALQDIHTGLGREAAFELVCSQLLPEKVRSKLPKSTA